MNGTAIPDWFVVVMGMGTVFFGLVCIVGLCMAMSKIVMSMEARKAEASLAAPAVTAPVAPAEATPIPNRQELIAAVSAALAEELGTDVSAIRILSFKKVENV